MGTTPTDVDYLAGQPGPGYGDSIGGMTIAGGIMGALFHRERTGEAVPVDVSLLGVGMWAMSPAVALSLQLNMPWRPGPSKGGGAGPANPLVGTYRTEDGRFLAFSCLQGFHYWPGACRAVGREDLIDDERFTSHEQLAANAGAAREILTEIFASAPLAEWRERLDVLRGPVVGGPGQPRGRRRPAGRGERVPRARRRPPTACPSSSSRRRCSSAERRRPRSGRRSSTSTATRSCASIDCGADEMMELKVAGVVA